MISPDGGEFSTNVLVQIEVEGLPQLPSRLPSEPIKPRTSFQNGVCASGCRGKPTWPACLDQLSPKRAVYGSSRVPHPVLIGHAASLTPY